MTTWYRALGGSGLGGQGSAFKATATGESQGMCYPPENERRPAWPAGGQDEVGRATQAIHAQEFVSYPWVMGSHGGSLSYRRARLVSVYKDPSGHCETMR